MAAEEAVIAARSALDETKIRESRFETKVADTKTIYDTAKLDLVEIEKKLSSCSNELKNLSLEKRKLSTSKKIKKFTSHNFVTLNALESFPALYRLRILPISV